MACGLSCPQTLNQVWVQQSHAKTKLFYEFAPTARSRNFLCNVLFVNLRSKHSLFQNFRGLGVQRTSLLGVSEFLTVKELEFPIFIDESDDSNGVVLEGFAVEVSEQERVLHRCCALRPDVTNRVERDERG